MSAFQKRKYCHECERMTLHVKSNPELNQTILMGHIAATVFTCGLWLPVLLIWYFLHIMSIHNQRFHCQRCGTAR